MWRFLVAIGAFAIATTFLVTGFVFTVMSGPRTESESVPVSAPADVMYAVLDSNVLTYKPGVQSVSVSGGTTNFVGYGRTIDVEGWLGQSPYVEVSRDAKTGKISSQVVTPEDTASGSTGTAAAAQTIVNPSGSDMWLQQASVQKTAAVLQMDIPEDMSVIIASDGASALPTDLSVSWPLPQPTFLWMGGDQLLIVGGGIAIVGIGLYLWALAGHRRAQGPRRKTPRPPRPPKPRRIGRDRHEGIQLTRSRGRRAAPRRVSMVAVPLALVAGLGLASCSSPYESGGVGTPTPTPTSTSDTGIDLPPVAVTEAQMRVIMGNLSTTAAQADKALDGNIAEARFTGPALEARRSNYAIRKVDAALPAVGTIPATSVALFLPEATDSWPRQLIAVFQPEQPASKTADPAATAPTQAIVMQQSSARENYKVIYQVNLQPNQEVPEVAVASTGTVEIPVDSKLLMLAPDELAAAYADVISRGDASPYAELFDATSDTLRPALATERSQQNADNVVVSYIDQAGSGQPIALATVDSGAIVAVTVDELGTFAPQGGRSLKLTGALKALAGNELSPVPIVGTYQFQLLFYVPPLGSPNKIQLLGYNENLVKVSQG